MKGCFKIIIMLLFIIIELDVVYSQPSIRDSILNCFIVNAQMSGINFLKKMEETENLLLKYGYLRNANRNGYRRLFVEFFEDSIKYQKVYKLLVDSIFNSDGEKINITLSQLYSCFNITQATISKYDKTGNCILAYMILFNMLNFYYINLPESEEYIYLYLTLIPYEDKFLRITLVPSLFLYLMHRRYGNTF